MLKIAVSSLLLADASAYFTKDKKCADQIKAVSDRTSLASNNNAIRTVFAGNMDGDNLDYKMQYRDDVETWGSDCNARRFIIKANANDLTFQVVDRAYYWWLFFMYWQFPLGAVKCTDGKFNKCILNKDVKATSFSGDTNWFYIQYGYYDYTCLPGFFGGKEELISTYANIKVPASSSSSSSSTTVPTDDQVIT